MTRPAAIVLAVLLVGIGYLTWRSWPAAGLPLPDGVQVGRAAPDFTLAGLDGHPLVLSALRGRPVLVNFWATWCDACREEMPHIERFYRANRGRLAVVGVDIGEPAAAVSAFVHRYGYTWRFVLDADRKISTLYGIRYIPTSVWLDPRGVVREVYTGPMTGAIMQALLAATAGSR